MYVYQYVVIAVSYPCTHPCRGEERALGFVLRMSRLVSSQNLVSHEIL